MKRYVKDKNRYNSAPAEHIEVSTKHVKLRTVLFILFIVFAIAFLAVALVLMLKVEAGWYTLTVDSSNANNGDDFVFSYYFGEDDDKYYREAVQSKYTDANVYAYSVFFESSQIDDIKNLYYLNTHPNEAIQVDALLYRSLKKFEDSGSRFLYYAPINDLYRILVSADNDDIASSCDITRSDELREYVNSLLVFVKDENHVKIEFYSDNVVKLVVSDEYINTFEDDALPYIDFSWTKNAFIIDYIADTMTNAGYTNGIISSTDGFTRNLADTDESYSAYIYDYVYDTDGKYALAVGTMTYSQKISVVTLKNYPLSNDEDGYYIYEDGTVRSLFINMDNGENKTAVDTLTALSGSKSCADIVVSIIPIYLDNSIDTAKIKQIALDNDIYSFYCDEGRIATNSNDKIEIRVLDRDEKTYIIENIE